MYIYIFARSLRIQSGCIKTPTITTTTITPQIKNKREGNKLFIKRCVRNTILYLISERERDECLCMLLIRLNFSVDSVLDLALT